MMSFQLLDRIVLWTLVGGFLALAFMPEIKSLLLP